MTGPESLLAFNEALRLVALGKYEEALAVEMLSSDRTVILDKIEKAKARSSS